MIGVHESWFEEDCYFVTNISNLLDHTIFYTPLTKKPVTVVTKLQIVKYKRKQIYNLY